MTKQEVYEILEMKNNPLNPHANSSVDKTLACHFIFL
jgi:hypothetical protein